MRKLVKTYIFVLLVCFGLTLSAQAAIVEFNEEWLITLQPDESYTCLAHFIPDIPNSPNSLIFTQPPEWTDSYSFDYNSAGWDTVLADGNKTAYLFGPEITNSGPNAIPLLSYNLYYQWDDEASDYDPNYPLYLDVVFFNDEEITLDYSIRGIPGDDPYESDDVTWREQNGGPPYENPVPEPMTICLLSLGTAFVRKRRSTFR